MAINRRLTTDSDFDEALQKGTLIRVFKDNQITEASATVIRFDHDVIVTQASVSDFSYHNRRECEFFELRRKR